MLRKSFVNLVLETYFFAFSDHCTTSTAAVLRNARVKGKV